MNRPSEASGACAGSSLGTRLQCALTSKAALAANHNVREMPARKELALQGAALRWFKGVRPR